MKILIDGKDYEFIYGYEPTIIEFLKKIKFYFLLMKKILQN